MMKKLALVFITLFVVLGCVLCAGCTTTPAEKYYAELLSELDDGSDMSQYYSSSGSATINGVTYSYESKITDGVRTMKLKLDDKEHTLIAPAQDLICGEWTGERNGLTVTFEDDGFAEYSTDSDTYGVPFFWGTEADGTYKFIFADNTARTATLSLDGLKDSEGILLQKHN